MCKEEPFQESNRPNPSMPSRDPFIKTKASVNLLIHHINNRGILIFQINTIKIVLWLKFYYQLIKIAPKTQNSEKDEQGH